VSERDVVAGQKLFVEKCGGKAYLLNQSRGKTHSFTTPGVADMLVFVGGHCFWNEVKDGDNKPEPEQLAFGAQVTKTGGLYVVTRSVDDLMDVCEELGIWR